MDHDNAHKSSHEPQAIVDDSDRDIEADLREGARQEKAEHKDSTTFELVTSQGIGCGETNEEGDARYNHG